ncbi:cutinase transcription factor 1 beta [Fusarium heterosporum]|uniref:Cutinase transcription factor 1 beta n=1 Tax=Fusarium heterosporum TaxID=42747 RepID=A0A8H5TYJ1_FUSHE|nr:cutinase transcription factor 1 beta [Fusarium heterosporum]
MIQEHQNTSPKPQPKRQEPRKRSPKKHAGKPDASEAEEGTVAKPVLAPKEDEDLSTVLTDECLGTPKMAEARPRQNPNHDHAQARPEITFAYYPFLCINNLSSLRTDDVNYLESQGCFRVPESSCLDDLIRAFFLYAHPILPVVNEVEFWSIYDPSASASGGTANRVPVVLLTAMLFVACKYVGDHVIQGMQLGTVHEARDRFLRKTQLLYDQETESSPVVLAQVCLLLTHWTSQRSSRTSRQSTQWLGRAIQHSLDAISHAKLCTTLNIRFNQSNLRRLLGCCILSDCIHSLYNRRPLMVPPDMVERDSDYIVLSRVDLSHEIGRSRVYGVEAKQQLIDAQEQMSALINILRKVLSLVYSQGVAAAATCRTASTLDKDENQLHDSKNRLKTWYRETLTFTTAERDSTLGSPVSSDDGKEHEGSQHDPVELLMSMMYLHYETAMLALCQNELLCIMANSRVACSANSMHEGSSFCEKKHNLSNCILNMTDRLSDSLQHQHLSKVPESMIFCTTLPLLLHLLNGKAHLQSSLLSSLQNVAAQCSRYPDWVRKVTKCLRFHYPDEFEFMLKAVKVVNNILAQSLRENQQDDDSQSSEEQLEMSNWHGLLDTRPRLYAHLVVRLDTVISWGGPLPETEMVVVSFNDCQLPRGSGLSSRLGAEKMSSVASQRMNEQRSSSISCSEIAMQLEHGAFLYSDGLHESPRDIIQSCLGETFGEAYSPISMNSCQGIWTEDMVEGGRRVLDQVASHLETKPTTMDCTDVDNVTLGDGLSDDWIEALLEKDISLQGGEDVDMDAAMTASTG